VDAPGWRGALVRGARIGVELTLGGALGALGAVTGGYAGLNADLMNGDEAGAGFAIGTSVGVALGTGPGVWLGGAAMGGDGSFGWTFLAGAVGTGLSSLVIASGPSPETIAIGALLPLSLSIAGYELSSHLHKPAKPERVDRASLRILPTVGPRYVGVVGSF
jgi:hypothetical protein